MKNWIVIKTFNNAYAQNQISRVCVCVCARISVLMLPEKLASPLKQNPVNSIELKIQVKPIQKPPFPLILYV